MGADSLAINGFMGGFDFVNSFNAGYEDGLRILGSKPSYNLFNWRTESIPMPGGFSLKKYFNLYPELLRPFMQLLIPRYNFRIPTPIIMPELPVPQFDINSMVWGDPHYEFRGSDGKIIKFDHQGTAGHTYNVFEGDNLHIEGEYAKYSNDANVIGKATIKAGKDALTFDATNNTVTINGKTINEGDYTLDDGTKLVFKGGKLSITPSDGTGTVDITRTENWLTITPNGKFGNLGGIIGTAIKQNRALSVAEADKFDITGRD